MYYISELNIFQISCGFTNIPGFTIKKTRQQCWRAYNGQGCGLDRSFHSHHFIGWSYIPVYACYPGQLWAAYIINLSLELSEPQVPLYKRFWVNIVRFLFTGKCFNCMSVGLQEKPRSFFCLGSWEQSYLWIGDCCYWCWTLGFRFTIDKLGLTKNNKINQPFRITCENPLELKSQMSKSC